MSSDAKDTDVTVKVIDVYPDGRAFNLDETIQRLRYRDGYDKPLAWMTPGKIATVTLHVGLGTFQPVRVDRVEDVRLHAERYTLSSETAEKLNAARLERRRVVAAGTTTVRTLEHCATLGPEFASHSGSTNIFISPGYEFRVVGALLTNFHLPQSTLLMLVCAFAGRERVMAAYEHAVRERYRFFSYGDCMFIA